MNITYNNGVVMPAIGLGVFAPKPTGKRQHDGTDHEQPRHRTHRWRDGSVGRHVVAEAVRQGYETRALVRDASRAGRLDAAALKVVGELTRPETLTDAVADIDAVVFTQGSSYGDAAAAEAVDYGAVKNVLQALGGRRVRIALMTSIGGHQAREHPRLETTTQRTPAVPALAAMPIRLFVPVGSTTTKGSDQLAITLLQGDTRHAGKSPRTE